MVLTTSGLSFIALRIGSNITAPGYGAIGTGSASLSANRYALTTEFDRNAFTSTDYTVQKIFTNQTDWSTAELTSGTAIKEFGLFHLSSGGVAWQVNQFNSFTMDGYTELQIINSWEVIQ